MNSGLLGLDKKLDYFRYGENIVYRVKHISHFTFFIERLLQQMESEKKTVHYVTLSLEHPFDLGEGCLQIPQMDPSIGFELFTLSVHDLIEQAGEEAVFLFDCPVNVTKKLVYRSDDGEFYESHLSVYHGASFGGFFSYFEGNSFI